jgi:catechol 2,3-dioxygenase-like lactoylglutathione lyase family enzyme
MADPKVQGLNHLTLAVTDLSRSIAFYRDLLGFELRAEWSDGAYLEAGSLWLCLSLDPKASAANRSDYTHYAFAVAGEDFESLCERVRGQAVEWKDNRSEGASLYFLDPDGHRLELHLGDLSSRLAHYRADPRSGVTVL